ncbi:MAG: hypothetical protein H5T66_13170, partial [Chloroflexi bacterium]|nr:hypothetical protein [Chloroflexota bacterium]
PSFLLDHNRLPDPFADIFRQIEERFHEMEEEIAALRRTLQEQCVREAALPSSEAQDPTGG